MADQEDEKEDQNEDQPKDMTEEDERENAENQILASDDGVPIEEGQPPVLTDERLIPVQDGQIPVDSSGIESGNFNAISPIGEVNIQFQQGNFQQITSIPKIVSDKVQVVTKTIEVLAEVALIELLGSSSMYSRSMGQCDTVLEDNQAFIDFMFRYTVDMWITQEIDREAISADANYVLDKLKTVPGIQISVCEIDVSNGSLTIQGRI